MLEILAIIKVHELFVGLVRYLLPTVLIVPSGRTFLNRGKDFFDIGMRRRMGCCVQVFCCCRAACPNSVTGGLLFGTWWAHSSFYFVDALIGPFLFYKY